MAKAEGWYGKQGLETFLVEWKLGPEGLDYNAGESLKPS